MRPIHHHGEPYFRLKVLPINASGSVDDWDEATNMYYYDYDEETDTLDTYNGTKAVIIALYVNGNGSAINTSASLLKYDSSVLTPAVEVNVGTKKNPKYELQAATEYDDLCFESEEEAATPWEVPAEKKLDTGANTICYQGGNFSYTTGEILLAKYLFLLEDGKTIDDVVEGVLAPNKNYTTIYPEGIKIPYDDANDIPTASYQIKYEGFKSNATKTVTSITVDTGLTKTKYYTGEDIDFSGAQITINYDNGEPDVITDINQAVTDGLITIDSDKASGNKKVVVTAGDQACDLTYNIVTNIEIKDNPTNMTYDHDDKISFAGGSINVIYDNGDKEPLDIVQAITDGKLTVDKTKADVNDKKVTFTYADKTSQTDITLTVNDPVVGITITSNPKTTYNHGETLDFTGGTIEVVKKSGAHESGISMTEASVTKSATTADLNACSPQWEKSPGIKAGTQTITVTYEGKSASFPITVDDTISSIAVKTDPTAKNKYGTAGNDLNLTGAELEVTTASNNKFTTSINVGMLDLSEYNNTSLTSQNLPVTYGGKTTTAGNGVNITLKDYITGITVTSTNDVTTIYDNELTAGDITGVTYVKNYASGATSSTPIPVTLDMISKYNKRPLANTFDNNHISTQTVTVTLNTADDSDIDTIPVTDDLTVKVKDKVTGITVSQRPNNSTFDYNGTFSAAGGRIKRTYASGALDSGNGVSMTDLSVTITETDGTEVNMTPEASEFTNGKATKTLKVTYTDETGTYDTQLTNIIIKDIFKEMAIKTDATKTFNHGDPFSTGNGRLTLTYESGSTKDIDTDDGTIITETVGGGSVNMSPQASEYTNNTLTKNLTVSYTEGTVTDTVNYDIKIINDVRSITIQTTPKDEYNVNDSLDLTNGEISVKRAVGTDSIISMSNPNVSVTGFSSDAENASLPLTVSYTENGITKTCTYNVEIKDSVDSIEVQNPPTVLQYGEDLNLNGTTIKVTGGSNNGKSIPVTDSMVSYDKTAIGPVTVTVTYGTDKDGNPVTTTFNITVKDYVTGITINKPEVEGTKGKPLSDLISENSLTYTVTYKKAGAQPAVNLVDTMVSTYNAEATADQNLTITYTDNDANSFTNGDPFTAPLTVKFKNTVTGITITPPTKATYNHGESLVLTGGIINLTYADGKKGTEPISSATIKESDGSAVNMSPEAYDSTNKVEKTLVITYTRDGVPGTVNYPIEIINDIKEIKVHSTNHKTEYNVNEALSTDNLEILVKRAVGTDEVIKDTTKFTVGGFSSDAENASLPLTVSYTENGITKTCTYNVEIKDSVDSIEVQNPPTVLQYGKELDLTNTTISITGGSNNGKDIAVKDTMISYDKTAIGPVTVTVTYGTDKDGNPVTTTFNITVKDYVTGITINKPEVEGTKGKPLSDLISENSLTYTVTYKKAGAQPAVNLVDTMVSTYNAEATADQNLTITYTDNDANSFTNGDPFTAPLTVKFKNTVTGITITPPTKPTYNHGDSLELAGGIINLTYADGKKGTEPISSATIKESDGSAVNMSPEAYDSTNKVEKTLVITYTRDGVPGTANYPIEIINDIKEIKVHSTNHKTEYNVNEALSTDNLEILVKRAVGTDEVIKDTTKFTVGGFSSDAENASLPLTVSYTENGITKTCTYNVEIKDSVEIIEVQNPPTVLQYGEDLNLNGTTIKVTGGSNNGKSIPVTDSIVSYDKTAIGPVTVTVTYGTDKDGNPVTDTFTVEVQDYVTGITLNPATVSGTYNDTLADIISDNSIKYTVTYAKAGAQTPVALAESMVAGYNPTSTTTQNLTVTYTDNDANSFTNGDPFTATLSITLSDKVTGVTVTGTAKNTAYNYGETLDFTGIEIYEQHASDTAGSKGTPVSIENATITDITDGETGAPSATTSLPANVFARNKQVTRTIRVSYSKDGKEAHVDFPITVLNTLDHIEIVTTPNQSYEKGDSIANAGGTIKIYRKADTTNSTEIIDITDEMITGLDTGTVGQGFIAKVTYEEEDIHGNTLTAEPVTYEYDVTETIQSITLNPGPDKTEYTYGEPIDLTGAYLDIVKVNGTTDRVAVTENMISGFNSTPDAKDLPDTQVITVTYGKYADATPATATFTVTVKDEITGITLTPPDKTTYKYGEELDLSTGFVQKVMASGAQAEKVPLTDESVKVTGFDPKKIGPQTVKVTYEGETKTFPVIVEENAISIKIIDMPKTEYEYGEKLDVAGGTIEVTRENGDKEIIPITESMVTGFNPNQSGPQTLTVTYGGQTDSYNIEVKDNITGIKITPPNKLVYNIGEQINLTGGKVSEITESGNTKTPVDMTLDMISGFDTSSEGPRTVTVTYKGKKATFSITVVDPLSDVQIITLPNKLTYKYGEKLDVTGGTIQITKLSGEKQTINMTPNMVTGYNPNKLGEQTLKVTYEGITKEFIVTVEDYITKLIVKAPAKTEYEYGEDLNLAGGKISIIMASGAVEENVEMTASMVSGFNKTKEGTQTIKVEYKGLQGNFQVEVIDKIKGISINTLPNKTDYKNGENLDLTGGTITVVKSSGIQTITITKDMVTGYNSKKAGQQVITVNYGGFTTEFVVTVAKKLQPTRPVRPSTKPVEQPIIEEPVIEEPIIEKPITPIEKPIIETPKVEEPIIEKPTEVLGVKDEQNNNSGKVLAGCIGALGLLFLLILIVFKRNVKVYVFEDGEFVLGGKDKITKKNPRIDIDKFLDEETYPNQVKIRLSDSISKKLDGKELEINHRGKTIKHTIKYNDEEYEIILK